MLTNKEYFDKDNNFECWICKYDYESWVTPVDLIDTRTSRIISAGSLCFALQGYVDDNGNYIFINEIQYFKEVTNNDTSNEHN